MIWRRKNGKEHASTYATADFFCRLFAKNMAELYHLSFLLTADHLKAEQCFVAGLEDSVRSNRVFREWARSWAKRTIIQNAIRELKPALDISISPAPDPRVVPPRDHGRHFQLNRIFALDDFERFVFVMSVLEQYSDHECSLLLASSPREIREARARAFAQLGKSTRIVSGEAEFERVQALSG